MDLEKLDNKLDNVIADVREIKTALKGYDGQVGLCKQVEKNTSNIGKIFICLAFLAGSTGIGFGLVSWLT